MDPFIEASRLFEDFHPKLIGDIERTLSRSVPRGYSVRLGERSYVVLASREENEERQMLPDVALLAPKGRKKKGAGRGTTAVARRPKPLTGPVTMRALVEAEFRETFVEIRQLRGEGRLATAIEILSPANKRRGAPGWDLYLRKRQSFLEGGANFVEIDLLRAGERMPMEDEWPDAPYYLLVSRKEQAPRCDVWPASALDPLPPIPIPLAKPDPDLSLDLQPLIADIYDRSKYEDDIDYRRPPNPSLGDEEEEWLKARLRERRT
jgi:hypothetical protein